MPSQAVIELHYLPCRAWMSFYRQVDELWLESRETYQKGSYRNRCHIAGPNGRQRLSIPLLKGKHQRMPIREVRISYRENWVHQHIGAIRAGYGKAPFFDFFAVGLFRILERKPVFLFDLNQELLHQLLKDLQLDSQKIKLTQHYQTAYPPDILDLRSGLHPKSGIENRESAYPQVFQEKNGFLPNLSVIDLLFCLGPEARLHL